MPVFSVPTSAWYEDQTQSFEIPEGCLVEMLSPTDAPALTDAEILAQIAASRDVLLKACHAVQKIVFVVDDLGRPTPAYKVIPGILKIIHSSVISKGAISFIIATGSHRPLTTPELKMKLGHEAVENYKTGSHDAFNSPTAFLGQLANGMPAYVNAEVADADLLIGIGSVIPHSCHGYGGGAKLFLPGVAGIQSISHMHGFLKKRGRGKFDSSEWDMRKASEEFAKLLPPIFSYNVMVNAHRQVARVISGDVYRAFAEAREYASKIYSRTIDSEKRKSYDVVIVNSYPLDSDPVQSDKNKWVRKAFPDAHFIYINATRDGIDYHGWKNIRKRSKPVKWILAVFKAFNIFLHSYGLLSLFAGARRLFVVKFLLPVKLDYQWYQQKPKKKKRTPQDHSTNDPWVYSQFYPQESFETKYPNGRLIRDWDEIKQWLATQKPKARIGVLPCAPIQIIK